MKISIKSYFKTDFDLLFDNFISENNLNTKPNYSECPCSNCHSSNHSSKTHFYYLMPPLSNGFKNIWGHCMHESCKSSLRHHYKDINKLWFNYVNNKDTLKLSMEVTLSLTMKREEENKKKLELAYQLYESDLVGKKIKSKIKLPVDVSPKFKLPSDDLKYHLSLFSKHDIIFLGKNYESAGRLFKVAELNNLRRPREFTSTYTFTDINGRRCSDNCLNKPYGVLELDTGISKEEQLALLLSIKAHFGIKLLLAIDTGGKSVHGWFRWTDLEPHILIFKQMGYDMTTLTSKSQPVRLAGAFRKEKGKYQRIIYYED